MLILGCAGSLLLPVGFSLIVVSGAYSSSCAGFVSCGLWA